MKPSASRIERMLANIEAKVAPPERKCLWVIVHEGDDEAAAMEKALAEHVASHPEDAGRTVRDFRWIVDLIVRIARRLKATFASLFCELLQLGHNGLVSTPGQSFPYSCRPSSKRSSISKRRRRSA